MESRLSSEVEKNSIVKKAVKLKRVHFPFGQPTTKQQPETTELDMEPSREKKIGINDKLVDYTRSKRAVQTKIESGFDEEIFEAQHDKEQIHEEINKRLAQLDSITAGNRDLN